MTARWLVASALTVSIAIVVSRGGPLPGATIPAGSGVAATDPGGRPQSSQPRRGETVATATANQGGGGATARSTPSGDALQHPGASAQRGAATNSGQGDRVTPQNPADQHSADAISSSAQRESRVAAAGNDMSTGQGRRGSGSATLNAPAGAASGSGAATAGAAGRAGGGVRDGALVAGGSRQAQAALPASTDRRTATYAEAYARAEAAVPAERVPADLRSYVRAYFLAIRPGSNP
jgi:hypothetical protein